MDVQRLALPKFTMRLQPKDWRRRAVPLRVETLWDREGPDSSGGSQIEEDVGISASGWTFLNNQKSPPIALGRKQTLGVVHHCKFFFCGGAWKTSARLDFKTWCVDHWSPSYDITKSPVFTARRRRAASSSGKTATGCRPLASWATPMQAELATPKGDLLRCWFNEHVGRWLETTILQKIFRHQNMSKAFKPERGRDSFLVFYQLIPWWTARSWGHVQTLPREKLEIRGKTSLMNRITDAGGGQQIPPDQPEGWGLMIFCA